MEENKRPANGGSAPEWTPQNNKSDNPNKGLKVTVIVLAAVAVVLAGVFAYVWIDRQKMIDDLTIDKQNLTNELIELQGEYAQLSSNNDSLNVQLDREREKVSQLLDRIKQTDAANRSKIRQYEKELGTLRSIMKHYIFQIDSLNTLNIALRKDAELARAEAAKSAERYQELSKTTDEYAKLVEQGSEIKGRGHRRHQRLQQGDRPQQPYQEAPHLPLSYRELHRSQRPHARVHPRQGTGRHPDDLRPAAHLRDERRAARLLRVA